ncbi:uncharacterized protein FOMMEDRAFT_154254 [Fomitiporia mediterranea MF3/22]|uniref:uncharacterized protein n=1 Tax=Fomitiporia mediterranea (strain MF3/22) TaxID=694068 RepID=UPI0004408C25|nr:uncharacterized protein FOMMEDRAFT_154254 [Fomitiporia mediterranea MF3/22]EJD05079.1 hypothetical protein FOMMEDRAFT_154254 [Fomitiporia mediterranea MF3/22]
MDVLLGPWGYVLGDNEDPQHEPISLYDLISNIHSKLHSPLDIIEIDTSKFPADCVGLINDYHRMLSQTDGYWRPRTECYLNDSGREYQKIDFIHRHTTGNADHVMTLKLTLPIPGRCSVALV